jgi:cytochrome c5
MPMTGRRHRGGRLGFILASALIAAVATACARQESGGEIDLALVDSVLAELGGTTTGQLERGQRWRMISSIGAGLPPSDFRPDDLPEPGSRGAGLLQVYCVQCHWLPTPQMHSAQEWKILVPRMLLRARTLRDRMGGPLTEGLVGEIVMTGLETVELPSPEETDSMLAYLQRNAFPPADPGELTEGPGRTIFIDKCSICHEVPSPKAHTPAGWDRVVATMRANMVKMDVEPLSDREVDLISGYLRERAAR